ncbi:MAG: hypothetical protein AAFY54_18325, partial [Cyanobacteria bacterium J06648_10]
MKRYLSLLIAALFGLSVALATGYYQPSLAQAPVEPVEVESPQPVEASVDESEEVTAAEDVEEAAAEEETAEGALDEAAEGPEEETLTASERVQRKLLIQADRAYESGNYAEAEALYRQAKDQTWLLPHQFSSLPPEPFSDLEQL